MKYQLEYHPNPEIVTVHLNKVVAKKSIQTFEGDTEMDDDERPQFVKDLFRIDGVESVTLQRYEVSLKKGTAFEWEEIISTVLELLNTTFNSAGELEKKGEPLRYKINGLGFREDFPDLE